MTDSTVTTETALAAHRAVQQTLAAQRIEGWEPQPAHIVELGALATGALAFDDYLARCREQYPSEPVRRRFLRRRAPYLIPGTSVLRNNFGIHDGPGLAAAEFQVTAGRMVLWHGRQPGSQPDIDVRALHRELFGDVYSWAGELRTVDLRRGDSAFTWQVDVAWLVRGGADPLAWLKRAAGRVASAHAKDIAPAGQALDEDGWADVGTGTLDWRTLAPACKAAGARWLVAEHDKPSDPARFAAQAHRFLQTLAD